LGQANFFFKCPNGVCYCGKKGETSTSSPGNGYFLARAPSVGATWEIVFDVNNMFNGTDRWGIVGCNYNPLQPEQVGIIMHDSVNGGPYFWLGNNGTFVKKTAVVTLGYIFTLELSYGFGKWMATTYGLVRLISADGTTAADAADQDGAISFPHVRASTTGITFHLRSGFLPTVGEDNSSTLTPMTDADVSINVVPTPDPTGMLLMTRYGAGKRGKSADRGATWALLPNLPFGGDYNFAYAGKGGSLASQSRWIAALGVVRLTLDWGDSWLNREGNITSIAPVPVIDQIYVLEY
jgi:hypothetical protein